MKKLYLVFTTIAILVGGMLFFSLRALADNSPAYSSAYEKNFEVAPFTSISASHGIQVFYTPSDERSVTVETQEKEMPNVCVYVDRSGTLVLKYEDKSHNKKRKINIFKRDFAIKAYVKGPVVSGFTSSLSSEISCTEPLFVDKALTINASTSGLVTLAGVKCASASLDAATSGSVKIDSLVSFTSHCTSATSGDIKVGRIISDKVNLRAYTSGETCADMLKANSVKASAATSGTVDIRGGAASSLDVAVSTSGDFNGSDFLVDHADAAASTSGVARINARSLNSASSNGGKVKNRFKD